MPTEKKFGQKLGIPLNCKNYPFESMSPPQKGFRMKLTPGIGRAGKITIRIDLRIRFLHV